jgi:hypothetical protein
MTNENILLCVYLGCITRKPTLKKSTYQQLEVRGVDYFDSVARKRWPKQSTYGPACNATGICYRTPNPIK